VKVEGDGDRKRIEKEVREKKIKETKMCYVQYTIIYESLP
jgi:hypothetical protein